MSTDVLSTAPKSPLGVIQWQGQLLCYHRQQARTDTPFEAVVFGSGAPVAITPELQAALLHDEARQQHKDRHGGT
jgi:hypothetical protein